MVAATSMLVSGTSHGYGKFGKLAAPDQFQICPDAPADSTKYFNSCSLKLAEGTPADTSHNHGIHRIFPQRFHGLTLPVQMMGIDIVNTF